MEPVLERAVAEAAHRLDAAAQQRLAALVAATVAEWSGDVQFDEAELAYLKRLDAEPYELAEPAEVAAFFREHGGR